MNNLGAQIKQARLSAKLTQEQLSELSGVAQPTISGWEQDKTIPDLSSFLRIAPYLDLSLISIINQQKSQEVSQ